MESKLTGNEPVMPSQNNMAYNEGLTIRQQFAMAAMQGMLANETFVPNKENYEYYAKAAVNEADLLIKALNEIPNPNL